MRHTLFLTALFAILTSCNSKPPTEKQFSDSTALTNDSAADSTAMAEEASRADDAPEDQDVDDASRDGVPAHVSEYKFLGFSEDLVYAAFATASGNDAKLHIVNVDRNEFIDKPRSTKVFDPKLEDALGIVLKEGTGELSNYRISGNNLGTSLHVDSESNVDIPFDNKIYKLRLIQKSAPDANKFFELQVLTDGEPVILQSDSYVPKSRGNVVSYKVVACFVLEDKIAVMVEYASPDMRDSEDQPYYNVRQLIVTGSLIRKEE